MTPRTLLLMIDEYNDIKKCEWSMQKYIENGGEIELERDKRNKVEEFYPDFFLM